MRCNMINEKQAKVAALKYLYTVDKRATHKYHDARRAMAEIMGSEGADTQDYQETLNSAMGMAYFKGHQLGGGEVYFTPDCRYDLVGVIADELKDTENYMTYQLRDVTIHLLGIDIDDIVSVLLLQKLIRSVSRYVNGRYITVYTKTW